MELAGGVNLYRYATSNSLRYIGRLRLIVGTTQTEVPNSATPFRGGKPAYNCLAWGLGVSDHWIQRCGDASPNTVPPKFGCKEIDCDAEVPCDKTNVMIFEDSKDPNNWHVMKQQCGKGWSSKNGQAPLYIGIAMSGGSTGPGAAELFYDEYYKPKGTFEIKC